MLHFSLTKQDPNCQARRGQLELFHGRVQTPAFMPVGTVGAVKTLLPGEVAALGAEIILGNTYHLYLRPGHQEIARFGGIQEWNKWTGPVLTDSGGFQVFSLGGKYRVPLAAPLAADGSPLAPADSSLRTNKPLIDADDTDAAFVKITEEGVKFKSYIDGSDHFFTPEKVIDIQLAIGSDIMIVLDECTEYPASYERAKKSMERTHRWAKRAVDYYQSLQAKNPELTEKHSLFGVVQGSTYQDLREESVRVISSLPFDGIAVGGVSVGEGKDHMYSVMDWTAPILPPEKPHYLLGIGEPEDLIRAVSRGYDMFDCVLPTRLGRYGVVWRVNDPEATADTNERPTNSPITSNRATNNTTGEIGEREYQNFIKWDLRASRFRYDQAVIDQQCGCPACSQGFSRAYIAHLLREREVTGIRLTTMHNLWTILNLFKAMRQSLEKGTFSRDFNPFIG